MSATLALLKGGKAAALNKELDGPDEEIPVTEDAAAVDTPEIASAGEPVPEASPVPDPVPAPAPEAPKAKAKGKKPVKGSVGMALNKVLHGEVLEADPIQDVAHQVENLTQENALQLARQLADEAEFNFFRLGAVMSVIQTNKWYAPYDSFRMFIESEFAVGYRTASYAIQLYRTLVDLGIPWEQVKSAGWTKLVAIKDVITPDNVDEWVAKADQHTAVQLHDMVKAYKEDPTSAFGDGPKPELETFTVKATSDQKQMIKAALAKAKNEMGDSNKSDGFALEMICTSYMNGGGKIIQSSQPKSIAEQIVEVGLVEFLNEVDQVLSKDYPKVTKFEVQIDED